MIRKEHRVALYARFSSDNQRTESIDAQLRAMHTYCQQNNFTIVETYVDEARSATSDRRPAFQQMIADSAKKGFDILLVHKLDRFARNRYDSAIYKRELKKNGVTVYSVLENLDNSPESIMLEAVLEGINEYYSRNLAREVMKGMKENALQGKHTGGLPPLGYDVDPVTKQLVINPEEAEAVRLIYYMYAIGEGYGSIVRELNARGYKTKCGDDFKKNSLLWILRNKKYNGIYTYNKSSAKAPDGTRNSHKHKPEEEIISIPGGCPKIIDDETFQAVQRRHSGPNNLAGGRNKAKHNYLLSGKVRCKECGKSMYGTARYDGRNKNLHITYSCPSKSYSCSNKDINRDYLERYVVELMEKHIFSKSAIKAILKRIDSHQNENSKEYQKKRSDLQRRLEETTTALTRVADAVAKGLISSALIDRLNELEQKKTHLEAELVELDYPSEAVMPTLDAETILARYKEVKKGGNFFEYRTFLQRFIVKIEVDRYMVDITLRTGLGISCELDTTFSVRRQEIYEKKTAT